MKKIKLMSILVVFALVVLALQAAAQQTSKALTNQDVISMVKSLLPESVILGAIRTNDTDFDVSASGLIALKKAGVTAKVMEAMLEAANSKKNAATPSPTSTSSAGTIPPSSAPSASAGAAASAVSNAVAGAAPAWQPTVSALQGMTKISLTAEATQIVNTKTKPTSLAALAADQALNQALQLGTQAAQQAALKSGSQMGLMALNPGAAIVGGLLSHHAKQAKVTYVWALNGGSSSANAANAPTFEVNYAGLPGVNPDQFEPVIVKLSPTPQSNFRLVGATEAATTAEQSTQPDWPVYSSFVEDRVPAKVEKGAAGHAKVTPSAAITPGEYAIVLRPTDKSHKFSGEEVGKNQAEGLLFNYAWPFSVK